MKISKIINTHFTLATALHWWSTYQGLYNSVVRCVHMSIQREGAITPTVVCGKSIRGNDPILEGSHTIEEKNTVLWKIDINFIVQLLSLTCHPRSLKLMYKERR